MALPAPRLLLLGAFLVSFCVACAPSSSGLPDDSVLSSSLRVWKSARTKEGQRYQSRSILRLLEKQPARRLTAVAGKQAVEIRSSNPEIRSQSDASVRVKNEEKALEQRVSANGKLIHRRMDGEVIQKPKGSSTLEQSEGQNASEIENKVLHPLSSDSAGEAQDAEKGATKKGDEEGVVPTSKPENENKTGGASYPAGNLHPDTRKEDIKKSGKGTKDILDPDDTKDDVEKQANFTEGSDSKQDTPVKQKECEESHCQDADKVLSACLRTSGDGTHMLSLSITNEGSGNVTARILAPKFLRADSPELLVKKGTTETVQFFMDSNTEASLLDLEGTITISSDHGECQIAVPIEYLRTSTQEGHLSYPSLHTPMAGIYALLLLVLMTTGICFYCRYRGKKRSIDGVEYQELEMNVSGVGTPKEKVAKSGGESADGWDQIWDDDWEDTEAVRSSSRMSPSLSSRGLAARRGNKDGWDE